MIRNSSTTEQIAVYQKLLVKDPRSTIFVPLCEVYRQAGRLAEAVAVAHRGIMENPALPAGYVALARIRYQQGDLAQAVDEFEKALILDHNNLTALQGLAKIRLRQNDPKAAGALFERMLEIDPNHPAAQWLARLEKRRSTTPESSTVVPKEPAVADEIDGEGEAEASAPIATITIAEIYLRQGFPEKALKVYRDLLRVNPQDEQLRQKLIGLKRRLEQEQSPVEEIPQGYVGTQEVSHDEVATPEEKTVAIEDSVVVSAAAEESNPLLEAFTDWLGSINRRRTSRVR